MRIRTASRVHDADAAWAILQPILAAAETYDLPANWSKDDALGFWFAAGHEVYLAETEGDDPAGLAFLRPNGLGGGAHVANAGFAVAPGARGQGVGRALAVEVEDKARAKGFTAMQFNHVVEANTAALRLWRDLGYREIGRVPRGFRHPTAGFVDQLIMFKELSSSGFVSGADVV